MDYAQGSKNSNLAIIEFTGICPKFNEACTEKCLFRLNLLTQLANRMTRFVEELGREPATVD